jgi:hypothetical protein
VEERVMHPFDRTPRLTKRSINIVFLLGLFALIAASVVSALAYQSQPQIKDAEHDTAAQQFIGTWQAELKGRPYFILRVTAVSPKVVGSFSIAPGLDVTPNGEVHEFWSPAKLSDSHALSEPKIDGNRITFSFKSEEIDEHPDTLEMTVTGPDEATIRLVRTFDNQERRFLSEEEIAKQMKPCHMKKIDTGAKKD